MFSFEGIKLKSNIYKYNNITIVESLQTPKRIKILKRKQKITPELLVKALENIPSKLLNMVKIITIGTTPSSSDAYWTKTIKRKFISFANADYKIQHINFYPLDTPFTFCYLLGTIYHEIGHFIDYNMFSYKLSDSPVWVKAIKYDGNEKVSKYATEMKDNTEDFADSIELYFGENKDDFVKKFPNRTRIIKRILKL